MADALVCCSLLQCVALYCLLLPDSTVVDECAAESFPAQVRGTAHGISAAVGKVGSIGVTVWFNYASTRGKYWITWPFALLGAFITWFFVADTTGLDLAEQACAGTSGQVLVCVCVCGFSRACACA